jgi:radical SAM protein with 4Fe4S-binding SPASM domain
MYQKFRAPISCQIELTTGCNLNCFHCYNHWRHVSEPKCHHMNQDVLQKALDEMLKHEVFHVTLTGGEPLMNRKGLFHAIEFLRENNIPFGLNSNLTLLSVDDGQRLKHLGLKGVLASFASSRPEVYDLIMQRNGSFDNAVRGITRALESGLYVAASMVVTKTNFDQVYETGKFLFDLGVKTFYATKSSPPVNSVGFSEHMLTSSQMIEVLESMNKLRNDLDMEVSTLECYPLCSYLSQIKYPYISERKCSAGVTTCSVGVRGDVRACTHDGRVYGNICIDGLDGSWNKMDEWRSGELLPEVCKKCSVFAFCSGGCRVDAEYSCGARNGLDPYAKPENVPLVTVEQPDYQKVIIDGKKMCVGKELRFRDENFCVLCSTKKHIISPLPLTHDTRNLLKNFSDICFTSEDISRYTGLELSDVEVLCKTFIFEGLIEFVSN